jgi:hypothetical protein
LRKTIKKLSLKEMVPFQVVLNQSLDLALKKACTLVSNTNPSSRDKQRRSQRIETKIMK